MYMKNSLINISFNNVLIIDVKEAISIQEELAILAVKYGINVNCDYIIQNLFKPGKIERRYIMSGQDLEQDYVIKVSKQSNFQLDNVVLSDDLKIKQVNQELKHEINYMVLVANKEKYSIHKTDYKLVKEQFPEITESYNELVKSINSAIEEESQTAIVDVWDR